jgi:hypothetical protein
LPPESLNQGCQDTYPLQCAVLSVTNIVTIENGVWTCEGVWCYVMISRTYGCVG